LRALNGSRAELPQKRESPFPRGVGVGVASADVEIQVPPIGATWSTCGLPRKLEAWQYEKLGISDLNINFADWSSAWLIFHSVVRPRSVELCLSLLMRFSLS
jgi:hypothetical protein